MKERPWAATVAAVLALAPRPSQACSCGVPGLDSALTRRSETWGVRLGERADVTSGGFNAHGTYRPLGAHERDTTFDLTALAAIRAVERLELSSEVGYGRSSAVMGGRALTSSGLDDVVLRGRLEALDEAPAWLEHGSPVDLALTMGVLVPMAPFDPERPRGLGAWEVGAGVVASRSLSARTRLALSSEAALRLPDRSLGEQRALGPRVSTQLTLSHLVLPTWIASAFSSLRWDGDSAIGGHSRPGSGMRVWQVGVGTTFNPNASAWRTSVAVRHAPQLSGISVNALATSTLELTLTYAR
jgi:hypothetical protein